MRTAVTSARYVLVALLRSVSPEKFSVGIRFHANTAVVRCRRSESITVNVIDTAMLVILNLRRITVMNKQEKDFWKKNEWSDVYVCPICKQEAPFGTKYRFCPNCGTRLYMPGSGINEEWN